MISEEKAKTKRCPIMPGFLRGRTTGDDDGKTLHYENQSELYYCLGSECMAWRWNQSPTDNAQRQQQASDPLGQLRGTHGYCGLAGKP